MPIIDCGCNNFPAGLGNVIFGANVGIGTTPAEWDSAFRGLQIGGTGTISAHSAAAAAGHAFNIMQNAYYGLGGSPPSVDFHYLAADAASRVMLGGGAFQVFTAPSGGVGAVIPWTERVRVANDGKVGINTPNPSERLEVNGKIKASDNVVVDNASLDSPQVVVRCKNTTGQQIGDAPAGQYFPDWYMDHYTSQADPSVYSRLRFIRGAVEVMTLDPQGNLRLMGKVIVSGRDAIDAQGYCLYG